MNTDEAENEQMLRDIKEEEQRLMDLGLSKALAKACMDDPFDYALRLRTGEVIAFSGCAVLNKEWVRICSIRWRTNQRPTALPIQPSAEWTFGLRTLCG